jgi:ribosomal protein S18 acetylase RimI-like enzyme
VPISSEGRHNTGSTAHPNTGQKLIHDEPDPRRGDPLIRCRAAMEGDMSRPDKPGQAGVTVRAPSLADAAEIGTMHLQTCLETYPNPGLGIDESWIHERWDRLATQEGTEHRQRIIRETQSNPDVLYRIAEADGRIAGFVHATRGPGKNVLEGIYTLAACHGTGVGARLMAEAEGFFDRALPTELEVAADNARAIAFYKKYGFAVVTGSEHLFSGKLPVVTMRRGPTG